MSDPVETGTTLLGPCQRDGIGTDRWGEKHKSCTGAFHYSPGKYLRCSCFCHNEPNTAKYSREEVLDWSEEGEPAPSVLAGDMPEPDEKVDPKDLIDVFFGEGACRHTYKEMTSTCSACLQRDMQLLRSALRGLLAWSFSGACPDCEMFRAAPSDIEFKHHAECAHLESINKALAVLGLPREGGHQYDDPKAEMKRLAEERARRP